MAPKAEGPAPTSFVAVVRRVEGMSLNFVRSMMRNVWRSCEVLARTYVANSVIVDHIILLLVIQYSDERVLGAVAGVGWADDVLQARNARSVIVAGPRLHSQENGS